MALAVRGNAEEDESVAADALRAEGSGGDGVADSALAADRFPCLDAMAAPIELADASSQMRVQHRSATTGLRAEVELPVQSSNVGTAGSGGNSTLALPTSKPNHTPLAPDASEPLGGAVLSSAPLPRYSHLAVASTCRLPRPSSLVHHRASLHPIRRRSSVLHAAGLSAR